MVDDASGRQVFDCDALAAYSQSPLVVALPKTRQQLIDVVKYAHRRGIPVVPRGAGTSLSGGSLPREDGILLAMGRMKSILEID